MKGINIENKLITDRPPLFKDLPFYDHLPPFPLGIDFNSNINDFLLFDLIALDGLQPIEGKYSLEGGGLRFVNPSEELITAYEKRNINFQLVQIIVNMYGFEQKDNMIVGKPYSISLKPLEKRQQVTEVSPSYFKNFDFETM